VAQPRPVPSDPSVHPLPNVASPFALSDDWLAIITIFSPPGNYGTFQPGFTAMNHPGAGYSAPTPGTGRRIPHPKAEVAAGRLASGGAWV